MRTPDSGFESLEQRYETLSRFIPYLLLVVPLIPYVLSQNPTAGAFGITVAVAVAAGAWVTWMVVLHPVETRRPWQRYVYFAGLLVFVAVLTFRSPWFAFFTWIGFLHAGQYLTGAWRWIGCAGVAIFFAHGPGRGISSADCRPGSDLGAAGLRRRRSYRRLHDAGREGRGAERGPQAHDRRAGRGEPPARGDDRREHRAAGPAAHPGQGGGRGGRAAADGPGDPRHHRPGPDRDRHPARGGPADQQRRRTRAADRQRQAARPATAWPRPAARSRRCGRRRWRTAGSRRRWPTRWPAGRSPAA